jgi:DNA polymerase
MKTLEIDIETFSSTDLKKAGVYKYAESPDFEILLFGYSIDGGEIRVVDLASGENLPEEVLRALKDPGVIKWAFNSQFERICLSMWLGLSHGQYLDPRSWKCSMVWSAYLGLPLSLEGVGAVLGLEKQKLTEGKDLIKYFCTPCRPTIANGQRTRNLACHDPVRWEQFKAYNARDVEVEIAIQKKLAKFPVPNSVWEEFHLDQEINDRGVTLDMTLVQNAIKADGSTRTEILERMKNLTGLENPNSVQQLKEWLKERGLETDTLGKKAVADLIKRAPKPLEEVLLLRQQLAKSSVKKYQVMENVACRDNRARGLFQFYGANRTGRWAGRLLQPQNLPRNDMPDLKEARDLVCSGNISALKLLYDSVPELLSQLIRTAFVPKPGNKFIVADFSSIERVVLAWLAGEQWVIDAYKAKKDLYIATASQMFKVPLRKIDKSSPLRQKGKVADLACIGEGQLVLTDGGLIPIEKVTLEYKVWDGENFAEHDGVVFRGEKEAITYGGLTATEDHFVWIEGQKEPVRFAYAAACGAYLLRTGNGGKAVRVGKNYKPGKTLEQKLESLPDVNPMCGLRPDPVDTSREFTKGYLQGVPEVLTTPSDTSVVRQTINSRQAKMRESKGCQLQKLRSKGYQIQFPVCAKSRSLDDREFGLAGQGTRNRQDKKRWPLRTRESSVCNEEKKLWQQENHPTEGLESNKMALYQKCSNEKIGARNVQGGDYTGCKVGGSGKKEELENNGRKVRLYDILNAGPNNRFTVSDCLVHNCGYGGSVGALKAMGALEMGLKEGELQPLVTTWRGANPNIVRFWWAVDQAALTAVRERTTTKTQGIYFAYQSGMLFITLPSGRRLAYAKPRIGSSRFGSDCVTYEGVGGARRWERMDSYGPKFVENIVQAISRDLLSYALKNLRHLPIVMHIHDEIVIEAPMGVSAKEICALMSQTPPWAKGLLLRAEGYECNFYQKD